MLSPHRPSEGAFFAALAPFAKLPSAGSIPIYQTALVTFDVVTMALLLGSFRTARSQRLFAVACAYLFTALITVAHTLSFPGLFAPQGVIGGGQQTTAWLCIIWHAGFPLLAFVYVVLPEKPLGLFGMGAWLVGTVLAAGGLIALATVGEPLLPSLMLGNSYRGGLPIAFAVLWLFSLAVLLGS